MAATEPGSEAYLEAFMNGFEFVLLAMRGRLAETDLPADERERLEAFIADYWRLARAYHDRQPAPTPAGLGICGRLPTQIEQVAHN